MGQSVIKSKLEILFFGAIKRELVDSIGEPVIAVLPILRLNEMI